MENSPTPPPAGPAIPTVADAAGDLAVAVAKLQESDRAIAEAVIALSQTIGTGICEKVEGMTLDLFLANVCRLIRTDRNVVMTAADVLRSMPVVRTLWLGGQLSWGQIRAITSRGARLSTEHREVLDRRLDQTWRDHDGVDGYGADGLLHAVDQAADELEGLAKLQRRLDRVERSEYLALQMSLDGGLAGHFELGPVNGAILANALNEAKPAYDPDVKRGKRMAQGLVEVAKRSLDGGDGRKAKPLMDVIVDLNDVTTTAAGTLDLNVPGHLPNLTARVVEAINDDATLRLTIVDGHRPLATSKKRYAKDTPASNVLVSRLRDKGDRTPGSVDPLAWTDCHHIVHREHGGDHDVMNLVNLAGVTTSDCTGTAGARGSTNAPASSGSNALGDGSGHCPVVRRCPRTRALRRRSTSTTTATRSPSEHPRPEHRPPAPTRQPGLRRASGHDGLRTAAGSLVFSRSLTTLQVRLVNSASWPARENWSVRVS